MTILNLPGWEVLNIQQNNHDYRIAAEYNGEPTACPKCGVIEGFYRHGTLKQLFMDTPIHGKRAGISVTRRRYKCRECNKTFMQNLPDIDEKRHATKRLVAYIEQESLKNPFTQVATEVGLNERTIRNIFRQHIRRLEIERRVETPNWMGIDEAHIANQVRCVLTDLEHNSIVDMLPGRSQKAVAARLTRLNHLNVQLVAIDMWRPYRDAVQDVMPQAVIVIDKFHVLRMVNTALDTIRKHTREGLTDKQCRVLKHDRFILLKHRNELDMHEEIILQYWIKNFPALGQAYELKESLYQIWNSQGRAEALTKFDEWKHTIPNEVAYAFEPFTTAMTNWREEVFNYFDHRITNAYTESLNGLLKITNRLGRGYSFEVVRAKMLYAIGVHNEPKPAYQRNWPLPVVAERRLDYNVRKRTAREIEISTLAQQIYDGEDPLFSTLESE